MALSPDIRSRLTLPAIGSGGGGHSGTISHLVLVAQIRAMFGGTIVLAGAVATGKNALARYLEWRTGSSAN